MPGRTTGKIPSDMAAYAKMNRYHITMLAHFVEQAGQARRTATARCWIIR